MRESQGLAAELVARVLAGRRLAESDWPAEGPGAAATRDLTLGTLRHLGTLRAASGQLAHRKITDARLEALLCVALYQIAHTRAAPYAIVDQAVSAARDAGLGRSASFLNAALRRYLRERPHIDARAAETPAARWSLPAWWVERLERQYGAGADSVLEACLGHPPMSVRPNLRRTTLEACRESLAAAGIEAREVPPGALVLLRPVPTRTLPGFAEGLLSVQDTGAQWAAHLLDLHPGQRVLDSCAAPGGKACHILETCDVSLTALDADAVRLKAVNAQFERLGLAGRVLAAHAERTGDWWDGVPFDRVLLDAPCSASGIVRRHADARWLRRESDLAGFARQQNALLDALWQVLAPGGKLLYVTCSLFAQENDEVAAAFLGRTPGATQGPLAGFPNRGGQLLPDGDHDGFFYALFQKAAGTPPAIREG